MSRPRDSQRAKVYRAEAQAFKGGEHDAIIGAGTLAEVGLYMEKVRGSAWWRKHFGRSLTFYDLADGRGCRSASYRRLGSRFTYPTWSRKPWVVLHEMAHAVTADHLPWHGREFCRHYLKLVRHYLGADAEGALKKAFAEHKVKWKKKRVMTLAAREALRERGRALAAARGQA